jgi:hypothetical protein
VLPPVKDKQNQQSIIVWTSKTLLPSLYKKEDFPLFGKEGLGEIFTTICLFNYGLVSKDLVSGFLTLQLSLFFSKV